MSLNASFASDEAEPRRLLRNEAYERIKRMIVSGDAAPGTLLSERQLSTSLNMSKTPIRNALERLDGEGFVTVSPQQGVLVKELSLHEIADLFETRMVLETFTVKEIAGTLTSQQKEVVEQILEDQSEAAAEDRIDACSDLDLQFHLALTRFLGNQVILRVMNQFRDKLVLIFSRHLHRNRTRPSSSHAEHSEIAQAIFAGDGDRAAVLMRSHLEYGRSFMLATARGNPAERERRDANGAATDR